MRRLWCGLVLCLLLIPLQARAAVLWEETFDWLSSDWSLDNDQDGSDGHCPAQIYPGQSWPNCDADTSGGVGTSCATNCVRGDSETPDIKITTNASRTGVSGDRGFRLYVQPTSCGTCDENGITDSSLWTGQTNLYFRWYMRFNFTTQTNYKKIFRFKDSGGSQRFILDMLSNGYLGLYTAADSFSNSNANTSWDFNIHYTPNTWTLFEIYIDQTNDRWTLWVDGVQKGSPVSFAASNYTLTGTMIGGNQCGTAGSEHIIDFDDLAAGTTYIGPAEASDTTAPTISGVSPSGAQSCTSDPRNVTRSAHTDEPAIGRIGATNVWADMTEMGTTGGTDHSDIASHACGASYSPWLCFRDAADNEACEQMSYSINGLPILRGGRISKLP